MASVAADRRPAGGWAVSRGPATGAGNAAGTTYRGPRRTEPARLPDGASDQSARQHSFYVSDDGDLTALRYDNWKVVFLEQRATGTLNVWAEPFSVLRVTKIFNLRTDPFGRADITTNTYYDWLLAHAWVLVPAQAYVPRMLATLVDFPPRQEPEAVPASESNRWARPPRVEVRAGKSGEWRIDCGVGGTMKEQGAGSSHSPGAVQPQGLGDAPEALPDRRRGGGCTSGRSGRRTPAADAALPARPSGGCARWPRGLPYGGAHRCAP